VDPGDAVEPQEGGVSSAGACSDIDRESTSYKESESSPEHLLWWQIRWPAAQQSRRRGLDLAGSV
jgi:hypothetical protein